MNYAWSGLATLILFAPLSAPPPKGQSSTDFKKVYVATKGLECKLCQDKVEKELKRINGVSSVSASWKNNEIALTMKKGHAMSKMHMREEVNRHLNHSGFSMMAIGYDKKSSHKKSGMPAKGHSNGHMNHMKLSGSCDKSMMMH